MRRKSNIQKKAVYLTETVVVGSDFHYQNPKKPSIVFIDKTRGKRKVIVNSRGQIRHFPGIKKDDILTKEVSPILLRPQVYYRLSFEAKNDKWLVLWTVRPDGRYWADEDGFGAEPDEEIMLYTYLDKTGRFTAPFSLYKVGKICYLQEE